MATSRAYTPQFFAQHACGSASSAERILPIAFDLLRPSSVADVGCGTGEWLAVADRLGIADYLGFDGAYVDRKQLKIPADRFVPCDLTAPLPTNRRFDLVLCLEVAEHLPATVAEGFVAELVRVGSAILFSAAIPFQGGTHHVNEQWPAYWANLFRQHGYVFCDCIRPAIWDDSAIEHSYAQNSFLLLPQAEAKLRCDPAVIDAPRSIAHPGMWEYKIRSLNALSAENASLSTLLRCLPTALRRSITRGVNAMRRRLRLRAV